MLSIGIAHLNDKTTYADSGEESFGHVGNDDANEKADVRQRVDPEPEGDKEKDKTKGNGYDDDQPDKVGHLAGHRRRSSSEV